jgi:hypothetical protein
MNEIHNRVVDFAQPSAAGPTADQMSVDSRRLMLRQFAVGCHQQVLIGEMRILVSHDSSFVGVPQPLERASERNSHTAQRDSKNLGDFAIPQSFSPQMKTATILFGKSFDNGKQPSLPLFKRDCRFRIWRWIAHLFQVSRRMVLNDVPAHTLSSLERKIVAYSKNPTAEILA